MRQAAPRSIVRFAGRTARLRLFCFPFAGGGASIFHSWSRALPEGIELCAIQPPGRESRIAEEPVSRLDALVATLVEETRELRRMPFVFFGHSIGALVAFEMTRALRRIGEPLPLHLFVSAAVPPPSHEEEPLSALADDTLIERLRELEGTPAPIIDNSELMKLFLPALRADLALRDGYEKREEPPLPIPITAFGGDRDAGVSVAELASWRDETTATFDLKIMSGGHFFIKEARREFLAAFSQQLDSLRLGETSPAREMYSHVS
jgi:medium-chain acyl-[acyl-carrier-protein] hydrolase